MQITTILLLVGLALLLRLAPRGVARRWLIFGASITALFALQPGLSVRGLGYWLPTATLGLTAVGWLLTSDPGSRGAKENLAGGGLMLGLALLVGLLRYADASWLFASTPPPFFDTATGLVGTAALALALSAALRGKFTPGWGLLVGMILLIGGLVVLKTPSLALAAAGWLRLLAGQNPGLASALDVRWLGFSYIAFRLVHTLRDRQVGRLPDAPLVDYVSYVIFFPSLVAGPIDRLERFTKDFRQSSAPVLKPADSRHRRLAEAVDWPGLAEPGRRILVGLVKKFAVADSLALVALSPTNALQIEGAGWMWLALYIYAMQIYFDFSGYTDIAVGMGQLMGVKLPENFAAPYLKPNLTQFWNSWHMSLTQWLRGYFFNPFVRWLRRLPRKPGAGWTLLITQLATMLLIGLWHGVTLNFILWGVWHGLGMFAQNRWTETTRAWFAARNFSPLAAHGLSVFSTVLTFNFVALGWVFFALPDLRSALRVFTILFGF